MGNGTASSQWLGDRVDAPFSKNKIIELPLRPYGTDNELVLCHSCMFSSPSRLREQFSLGVFI